jgi:hypothetical protein
MSQEEEAKNLSKSSEKTPDKSMDNFETPQRKKKRHHENKSDSINMKLNGSPGTKMVSHSKTECFSHKKEGMLMDEDSQTDMRQYFTSTKNARKRATKITHLNTLSGMMNNYDRSHGMEEYNDVYPQIIFHSPY